MRHDTNTLRNIKLMGKIITLRVAFLGNAQYQKIMRKIRRFLSDASQKNIIYDASENKVICIARREFFLADEK